MKYDDGAEEDLGKGSFSTANRVEFNCTFTLCSFSYIQIVFSILKVHVVLRHVYWLLWLLGMMNQLFSEADSHLSFFLFNLKLQATGYVFFFHPGDCTRVLYCHEGKKIIYLVKG